MNEHSIVKYLNEHYSINGSFYWIGLNAPNIIARMIPSSQKNTLYLNRFGIGSLHCVPTEQGHRCDFWFYDEDLRKVYGFTSSEAAKKTVFRNGTIDEVMQQVSAFIIVNGMCDLRHKELNREQSQNC